MGQRIKPLAVTVGDPGGVGPEIVLAMWLARKTADLPPFYALADPRMLAARAARLGWQVPIGDVGASEAVAAFGKVLPVVSLRNCFSERIGASEAANAAAIVEAIDRAVEDTLADHAAAMVTGPIAKKSLYDAGFAFPGHTEYLAHLAGKHTGVEAFPVMMLAGPELRAVPVTIHVPLAAVPDLLTTELIVTTARITARDLAGRFGLKAPRLAISGLNPHAGEGGAMGKEDLAVVAPAVAALRAEGIDAVGPLPADTLFHARARATYDAAICMYHDQALIPAKTLAFDEAVNVTLGLPFIRTSPDHGTAFDLAGSGTARPESFTAALKLARLLASHEGTR